MPTQTFWLQLAFWDFGKTHVNPYVESPGKAMRGLSRLFPEFQNDKPHTVDIGLSQS